MIGPSEISSFFDDSSNFVTTAEGVVRAGRHLWTAVNTLTGSQTSVVNQGSDRLRKALRVNLNSTTSFRLSDSHPTLLTSQTPSADLSAFIALAGPEFVEAVGDPSAYSNSDPSADIEEDLVLFGSPESETFTRHLFGYRYSALGDKLSHLEGLPLQFRWDEDPTSIVVRCLHYRPGGVVAVRPNWPLFDSNQKQRIFPLLKDGFLTEDYLIITRIPNYATVRAHQSGRAILSISGLHGIGTSAIDLVLKNSDIAHEIADMAENHLWFQAVIRISEINHDEINGSKPASVKLKHLISLDLSDAVLEAARQSLLDQVTSGNIGSRIVHKRDDQLFGVELYPPFTPENFALIDAVRKHGSAFAAMSKLVDQ